MAPVLGIEDLSVAFGERPVLDGISLSVEEGEVFVIMGPSGCGKTTLIRSAVGLQPIDTGRVLYRGEDLADPSVLQRFRRRMGMVFQQGALLNSMPLEENVALPLREHTDLSEEMIRQVVRMKLAQVGLLPAARLLPSELSGGMRKRGGIARALALEPEILFFDEPTGGLDPITADGIDNLVLALREQLSVTIVVVTHELASIFKIADRVMMLKDGVVAVLESRERIRDVEDEAVRNFVGRRAPKESGAADVFLAEMEGGAR